MNRKINRIVKIENCLKHIGLSIIFISILIFDAFGQVKYIAAENLTFVGKPKKTENSYQRIDRDSTVGMPESVRKLAMNSAGIAVIFETNSPLIRAKWDLAEFKYMANMTPIGHSGLDLYCYNDGKWQFVNTGKPVKDSIHQNQLLVHNMDHSMKQFMLYLPLYNTLTSLEIGVDPGSSITASIPKNIDMKKRLVVYGSSIVQGASASRPGMAYPAILQRKLGIDVINLGFSGSAKMEMPLAEYLATVPADCFVLDCIPNPSPTEIKERGFAFIDYLRRKRPHTPIILVETVIRENGHFDQHVGTRVSEQNKAIQEVYAQLTKKGITGIHYITADELMGTDHEATIDGVHLTDLGFDRISNKILQVVRKIQN
ncbi:SGNH/GDSL hydrolase family protein [Sphingobacterium sp. N143]|uniref:SGNH/GDSL hydrolase family protein n=1 Tax=Sphingobacterium sp. N143 TaxID=2746727 RepID=UPI00257911BB|nr:SGNH/GDSL hydrolase family protein [Sphingobacterium sp. N143]